MGKAFRVNRGRAIDSIESIILSIAIPKYRQLIIESIIGEIGTMAEHEEPSGAPDNSTAEFLRSQESSGAGREFNVRCTVCGAQSWFHPQGANMHTWCDNCGKSVEWEFIPVPRAAEAPEPMLQFFEYKHLPEELKEVSRPFGLLAIDIVHKLPRNPERTVALRKLLEAKDCAVRAKLFKGRSIT